MKDRLSTDLSLTFHYAQVAEDRGAGKPCKACPVEALQGNYGYCRDHRNPGKWCNSVVLSLPFGAQC